MPDPDPWSACHRDPTGRDQRGHPTRETTIKASARILITAATLTTLTILGPAATAAASVPMPPQGPQHSTTTVEPRTVPHVGHGAQVYHDAHDLAPVITSQAPPDRTTSADAFAVLGLTLLSLLVGVAGAPWLRRRRRLPAAV